MVGFGQDGVGRANLIGLYAAFRCENQQQAFICKHMFQDRCLQVWSFGRCSQFVRSDAGQTQKAPEPLPVGGKKRQSLQGHSFSGVKVDAVFFHVGWLGTRKNCFRHVFNCWLRLRGQTERRHSKRIGAKDSLRGRDDFIA